MSNLSSNRLEPDPRSVSTLLNFEDLHRHQWKPGELADMLRHQLNAPLQMGVGTLSAEVAHQLRKNPQLNPLMTLSELLALENPPVELLKLVKRFAKICKSDPGNPLPPELVMLLYYAAIAAAIVRLNQRISELQDGQLRRGLRFLAGQAWVAGEVRTLLAEALAQVPESVTGDAIAMAPEQSEEPIAME